MLIAPTDRALLWALVVRNIKVRYQRSILGVIWALLNPVLIILCLIAVFTYVVRIPLQDYWAFLLSGYFAWVYFAHTVSTSVTILREHSQLIRSVRFPPVLLVWSNAISRGIEFAIEITLVAVVLAFVRHDGVPASYALIPLAALILMLLTVAFALPVAAVGVFFHDTQHGLPVLLTALGYISPVFYSLYMVPETLRAWFLVLNPLTRVFPLFHAILYEGRVPPWFAWVMAGTLAWALCVVGHAAFRWRRPVFAEVV
ncbi:MAG: ABC transporter permease [Gemmatimonadaceae bacterium]|nr:ABC transporter permease [Gemmatimonadaceae bacterium]